MKRDLVQIGIALVVALMLWFFAPQVAGLTGFCSNEILAESHSPTGNSTAVVFRRSCGATTTTGTNVSIRSHWQPNPLGSGNLFLAVWSDSIAYQDPALVSPEAEVVWMNERTLVLTYDAQAEVWLQKPSVRGVIVTYRKRGEAANGQQQSVPK